MDKEKFQAKKDGTKKVTKDAKKVVESVATVKKGVGVGLHILDSVDPATAEKAREAMDNAQNFIESKGEGVEKVIDKVQTTLDHVVGDRIEAIIDSVETTIQNHGGKKIEQAVVDTVDAVSDRLEPLLRKGAKLTVETAKILGEQAKPVVDEIGQKVGDALGHAAKGMREVGAKILKKEDPPQG